MLDALVDDSSLVRAFEVVPKASLPPVVEVPPWHATTTKFHELQHDCLLIRHAYFLMWLWYVMRMEFSS